MNKSLLYAVLVGSLLCGIGFGRCEKPQDEFVSVFPTTAPCGTRGVITVETISDETPIGGYDTEDHQVIGHISSKKSQFWALNGYRLSDEKESSKHRNARLVNQAANSAKEAPGQIAKTVVFGLQRGGQFLWDHRQEIYSGSLTTASWTWWGVKNILHGSWWLGKQVGGIVYAAMMDGVVPFVDGLFEQPKPGQTVVDVLSGRQL